MRIIIYGAGAVGGMLAAYLELAGVEAILVARPQQSEIINSSGIHLAAPSGEFNVKVKAVGGPRLIDFKPSDMVFLTVKSQDTLQSLTELKKCIPDIPVFCMQNGIANEITASGIFRNVYGSMVMVIAYSIKTGVVIDRAKVPGYFITGRYPAGLDETADKASEALVKAGFISIATEDIMAYKWEKLIVNLSNAPNAITNSGGIALSKINYSVIREAESILQKAGIKRITMEEINSKWPETKKWPGIDDKFEVRSSTWQSLERGTAAETEYLNGEIVKLAEKIGIQAPVNMKLCEIVRGMSERHEKPGKYTPSELEALLGID